MRNIKCFSFFKMELILILSFFVANLEIHKGLRFVCMTIITEVDRYCEQINQLWWLGFHNRIFQQYILPYTGNTVLQSPSYLTYLRCIIHANYNPLSFVKKCALACLLHFCAIESTLSHLSVIFDFLFPKIWDRSPCHSRSRNYLSATLTNLWFFEGDDFDWCLLTCFSIWDE